MASSLSTRVLVLVAAAVAVVGAASPVRVVVYSDATGVSADPAENVAASFCQSKNADVWKDASGQEVALDDTGCASLAPPRTLTATTLTVSWMRHQKTLRLTQIAKANCFGSASACVAAGALVDLPFLTAVAGTGSKPDYATRGLGHEFVFRYNAGSDRYVLSIDGAAPPVAVAIQDLVDQASVSFPLPSGFTFTANSIRFLATNARSMELHASATCLDAALAWSYYSDGTNVRDCHSNEALALGYGMNVHFRVEAFTPLVRNAMWGPAERICHADAQTAAGTKGRLSYGDADQMCTAPFTQSCTISLRDSRSAGVCIGEPIGVRSRFSGAKLTRAGAAPVALELVPEFGESAPSRLQLTKLENEVNYMSAFAGAGVMALIATGSNNQLELVFKMHADATDELLRVPFAYTGTTANIVFPSTLDLFVLGKVVSTTAIEVYNNAVCAGVPARYPYNKNVCHDGRVLTYMKPGNVNMGSFKIDASAGASGALRVAVDDATGVFSSATLVIVVVVGLVLVCAGVVALVACAVVAVAKKRSAAVAARRRTPPSMRSRSAAGSRRGSRYGVHGGA